MDHSYFLQRADQVEAGLTYNANYLEWDKVIAGPYDDRRQAWAVAYVQNGLHMDQIAVRQKQLKEVYEKEYGGSLISP